MDYITQPGKLIIQDANPFPSTRGVNFTAAIKGENFNLKIPKLLDAVVQVAMDFAMPGTASLAGFDKTQIFFYHLIRGIKATNAKYEHNLDLGITLNPVLLNTAFRTQEAITLDQLRSKKVLLSFSGGKESVLLRHMLEKMGVAFDTAHIYDALQTTHGDDGVDWQVALGNIYHFHPIPQMLDFGVAPPIVLFQRILMWAYADAHGYDYVLFGDEIDNQAIYTVNDKHLYPSGSFFQSQYFYNILNALGLSKTKLVSALMNFSQERIYEYLINHDLNHFSCLCSTNSWCNRCTKCKTTAYYATHWKTDMYAKQGLDYSCGYTDRTAKEIRLDFSQSYNADLFSLCKPLVDDGFADYYKHCIRFGMEDNNTRNPNVYYDMPGLNSFDYSVLHRFAQFWR